jgi:hypothetical protein
VGGLQHRNIECNLARLLRLSNVFGKWLSLLKTPESVKVFGAQKLALWDAPTVMGTRASWLRTLFQQ